MDKKIVLIGAGSASFGPPTLMDIFQSEVLTGSTIVLLDINEEKLNRVYDIVVQENIIAGDKFNIEKTTDRSVAIKDADFVICSIENGDRFELRWQDNTIPHKHGSTEMMAENGGPGGFFHSARQIPQIVQIAKEVYAQNPNAYFINYSNPLSRICLAIKRSVPDLNSIGLCHQINLTLKDLPYIIEDSLQPDKLSEIDSSQKIAIYKKCLENTRIFVGGLNHFAFILNLQNVQTGESLMSKFNNRIMDYYKDKWDPFHYANLTFEVFKRFGWFPYVGDNHIAEYLQISSHYTKYQDFVDWITKMEQANKGINDRFLRYHKRLKKGKYPKKGMMSGESQDLVIECNGIVNKEGVHGVKIGKVPKGIAALLRIEASIQDVCVEAILTESKELAIACIAMDVNCGSFEMAENIFNEMNKIQKKYLPNFK